MPEGNKPQGQGVATAIGAIKWVIIAILIVVGVVSTINIELNTTVPRVWEVVTLVATAVWCLGVWVLFGWFEHALLNLVRIERNTRPMGTELVTPTPPVDQQRS
ncbi:hypothetical protein GCM10009743_64520 [Kribbella swartbergensis]